jgi:hypothetical protein
MSRSDSFGIAAQEDWGDPEETMTFFIPVETVDVSHNNETIEVEETTGTRFPARIERGTRFGELTVEGPLRSESAGLLLYATFGVPATTGGNGTAFLHVFDPAVAGRVPKPVSLLVNRTDPEPTITDRFHDALCNELTISCEPNGHMRYSASFIAKDYLEVNEPSTSYDFSHRWPFFQAKAYLDVEGGGEAEVPVGSWSMTYSNNIPTDVFVLGQRTLWELVEDNASMETSFLARSDFEEHYRRALADEPDACKLRVEAIGPTMAGSTDEYRFEVIQWLIEETDAPANLNAAERMTGIEVTARAAFDDDNTKFVTVDLDNLTASYAEPVSS